MKEIDAVINEKPSEKMVKDLAELKVRNNQCFRELEYFNKTGKWMNRHPLLKHFSLHAEMKRMLERNPGKFLEEYTKVSYNVTRYRSFLNNDNRSEEQHQNDQKNLDKHIEREKIMKEVLDERNQ